MILMSKSQTNAAVLLIAMDTSVFNWLLYLLATDERALNYVCEFDVISSLGTRIFVNYTYCETFKRRWLHIL